MLDGQWHDAATKLDLAKAYQEMGDVEGAREILQEVLHEGDDQQKSEAQALLAKLGLTLTLTVAAAAAAAVSLQPHALRRLRPLCA